MESNPEEFANEKNGNNNDDDDRKRQVKIDRSIP